MYVHVQPCKRLDLDNNLVNGADGPSGADHRNAEQKVSGAVVVDYFDHSQARHYLGAVEFVYIFEF